MFFFFSVLFLFLQVFKPSRFPRPKGSSPSCRPAGALFSFCPFASTVCSRLVSGKVLVTLRFSTGGSRTCGLSIGRQQLQAPAVRTCLLPSPGNRSSYAVAGNQETLSKPAAPPTSGLFQENCRTVTMASCQARSGC